MANKIVNDVKHHVRMRWLSGLLVVVSAPSLGYHLPPKDAVMCLTALLWLVVGISAFDYHTRRLQHHKQ